MVATRWTRAGDWSAVLLLSLVSIALSPSALCSERKGKTDLSAPDRHESPTPQTSSSGSSANGGPQVPVRLIDLRPLDYRRPSPLRSRDGGWHLTIHFLDENRLLATFEGTGVVRRLRSCPKSHDDRIVHVAMIDPKSGEVIRRADWYLHDFKRYLWPLASGKMLLRRGTDLFELDGDLDEKLVLEHVDPYWLDVTPDGKRILIGTATAAVASKDDNKSSPKWETRILDAATLASLGTFPLDRPIPLQATSTGYADVVLKNGWTWLVRFGSLNGPAQSWSGITRVRSTCIPDLEVSSENTLLVGRCTTALDRYVLSSFTTSGHFLWRQRWSEQLSTPVITRSMAGARFALSSITLAKQEDRGTVDAEDGLPEVRRNRIEIFNSATGISVLKLETEPAITVGGNVALSPEGTTLAVLRDNHLELYELPKLMNEEAAKLAAVRAGTPGLIPPKTNNEIPDEEMADDNPGSDQQVATDAASNKQSSPTGTSDSVASARPTNVDSGAQATDPPAPIFRSRSEAVVVDVVVTDSKGHAIPGLTTEDFNVNEDGATQKISFFEEHSVADTRQTTRPNFERSPNIFSNVSNTSQPDSATLILLDVLNTPAQDQASAREALIRYIKKKPKNESFALCVLAGPLRLIRGFTTDEKELLLAMQDRRSKPSASFISQMDSTSLALIRTAEQRFNNPFDVSRSVTVAAAGLERTLEDQQLSQDDMRTYLTIAAFGDLARYMAGVPGRKKILWLSAAFPLGRFATEHGLDSGSLHQQRDFVRLVSKTMNLLASAHVSVFPVDVRGVTANGTTDIASVTPLPQDLPNSPLTSPFGTGAPIQVGGGGPGTNTAAQGLVNDHPAPMNGFVARNFEDSARRNSEHTAMDLVAEQTGGKAFYGSNDIEDALHTIVEQGADYYTISYTPSNRKYDGRFRTIRVNVAGRKYRVSHRSGYYAEDPKRLPESSDAIVRNLSQAGMTHGAPESRQIPFEVRLVPVGEPRIVNASEAGVREQGRNAPMTIKLQRYNLDYAISAAALRFDPGPEGNLHGSFRLLANSFDSEGRTLMQATSTAVADFEPHNYPNVLAEGLRLQQQVDVPVDAGFLRLGVGDMANNYTGTLELPLPISVPKNDPLIRTGKTLPPVEPE